MHIFFTLLCRTEWDRMTALVAAITTQTLFFLLEEYFFRLMLSLKTFKKEAVSPRCLSCNLFSRKYCKVEIKIRYSRAWPSVLLLFS